MTQPKLFRIMKAARSWAVVLSVALPSFSSAETFYVDATHTGSETGSETQPFTTITAAVEAAGSGAATIVVRDGLYQESIEIDHVQGLVLRSQHLHGAVLEHDTEPKISIRSSSNVTIAGFEIRGGEEGILIHLSSGVTVRRNLLHDLDQYDYTSGAAFRVYSSEDIVLERNVVRDTWGGQTGGCARISSSEVTVRGNHFERCRAWNSGGGLYMTNAGGTVVQDNVFDSCRADFSGALHVRGKVEEPILVVGNLFIRSGPDFKGGGQVRIEADRQSAPVYVSNNHFDDTFNSGWQIRTGIYANSGTVIANGNLFRDTKGFGIYANRSSQVLARYNLFAGVDNSGFSLDSSNLFVDDPRLALMPDGTFDLMPDSPARDAGHPAVQYRDADSTRNDMGMKGGRGGCGDAVPGRCTLVFDAEALESYVDGQDVDGVASISEGGATITLTGNTWKSMPIEYDVLPETNLDLWFRSGSTAARVQAIALTLGNRQVRRHAFQLAGSQEWGIQALRAYDDPEGEWRRYRIPVGRFYTGPITRVGFVNGGPTTSESSFSGVRLYEGDTRVDFSALRIEPHSAAQFVQAELTVGREGRELAVAGNGWVAVDLPYTVTAHTVLELALKSEAPGEALAVGLQFGERERFFQLAGHQQMGIQAFHSYDAHEPGHRQSYRIPVGRFVSGDASRLIFVVDEDRPGSQAQASFSDVRLLDADMLVNFGEVALERPGTGEEGSVEVSYGGDDVKLIGPKVTLAVPIPLSVNRRTVVQMVVYPSSGVTFAGFGVSATANLDERRTVRLVDTTSSRGIGGYASDSRWWRTVELPLGELLPANRFRYLVLYSESSDAEAATRFEDVRFFER